VDLAGGAYAVRSRALTLQDARASVPGDASRPRWNRWARSARRR